MAVTRYAWLFGCGWTTFGYMAMIYALIYALRPVPSPRPRVLGRFQYYVLGIT